ncbi:MAG: SDR family NAD(P)-dependent oxidoreductase, partial [Chitinivibrionales bacterium]|nr:SDR family NAD(P)-dependent oxidoreductase [Chitinivibrionales bacterium]
MNVRGKVAVITGGALGIGRATCVVLAREGVKVAVTDIRDEEGRRLVEEIQGFDGRAMYRHLDTANEEQVRGVFADVEREFGAIDVLVNNAGISGVNKPTDEVTEEEWDRGTDINVKGVFFCTKHAVPYMRKAGGGSIVNLSSIYGIIGGADIPPYHASKGAVRLMTKNDALLYAKDRIRVNSVHPGFIWTPLVEELGRNSPEGVDGFRSKLDSLH